eukprot:1184557-Prorocentrum_minimum.AAC.2
MRSTPPLLRGVLRGGFQLFQTLRAWRTTTIEQRSVGEGAAEGDTPDAQHNRRREVNSLVRFRPSESVGFTGMDILTLESMLGMRSGSLIALMAPFSTSVASFRRENKSMADLAARPLRCAPGVNFACTYINK